MVDRANSIEFESLKIVEKIQSIRLRADSQRSKGKGGGGEDNDEGWIKSGDGRRA